MTYRVVVAHEAEKALDRLDRPTECRIRARFLQLAEDPFDPRLSAPLTERPGVRKPRVGGWPFQRLRVQRHARMNSPPKESVQPVR